MYSVLAETQTHERFSFSSAGLGNNDRNWGHHTFNYATKMPEHFTEVEVPTIIGYQAILDKIDSLPRLRATISPIEPNANARQVAKISVSDGVQTVCTAEPMIIPTQTHVAIPALPDTVSSVCYLLAKDPVIDCEEKLESNGGSAKSKEQLYVVLQLRTDAGILLSPPSVDDQASTSLQAIPSLAFPTVDVDYDADVEPFLVLLEKEKVRLLETVCTHASLRAANQIAGLNMSTCHSMRTLWSGPTVCRDSRSTTATHRAYGHLWKIDRPVSDLDKPFKGVKKDRFSVSARVIVPLENLDSVVRYSLSKGLSIDPAVLEAANNYSVAQNSHLAGGNAARAPLNPVLRELEHEVKRLVSEEIDVGTYQSKLSRLSNGAMTSLLNPQSWYLNCLDQHPIQPSRLLDLEKATLLS